MKRTWLVATLAALFLLAGTSPAYADDGGLRHIDWPAHNCSGAVPTHVDLYMHDWYFLPAQSTRMDGRIRIWGGTCAKAAGLVHIYKITLWQYTDTWHSVASSGAHDVAVIDGGAIWSTPDVACLPPDDPKSHVEVQYMVFWKDGTHTAERDDNSYDWKPTSCSGP